LASERGRRRRRVRWSWGTSHRFCRSDSFQSSVCQVYRLRQSGLLYKIVESTVVLQIRYLLYMYQSTSLDRVISKTTGNSTNFYRDNHQKELKKRRKAAPRYNQPIARKSIVACYVITSVGFGKIYEFYDVRFPGDRQIVSRCCF